MRRDDSDRGGSGLMWLMLSGLGVYLLSRQGGAMGTVPGAPTFWTRAEDGQVVASHTGPPNTAAWAGAWGNWTPADPATVAAANATASIITIS